MVGLTILAVVAVYIGIVWALVRFAVKNNWARAGVILTALAIPFWDLPYGYYNFKSMCAQEGGLRILEKFGPSRDVLFDYPIHPEPIARYGFTTIEYPRDGKVNRYTATTKATSVHQSSISSVRLSVQPNQVLPGNLVRRDYVATRIGDGRLLARHSDFKWEGLWWQRALSPLLGDGGRCHFPNEHPLLSLIAAGKA